MFKGILIDKDDNGYRATLQEINDDQLPEGDVTVRVAYSTLNFKGWPGDHGQQPGGAKIPDGAGDRSGRHCRSQRASGLQGW